MANPVIATISNNGSGTIISGVGTQITTVNYRDLVFREGVWRSAIFRDKNTPGTWASSTHAKYGGNPIRGQVFKVKITNDRFDASPLRSVGIGYVYSELSY